MKKLVGQILAGIIGIFLATKFIEGVSARPGTFWGISFNAAWQIYILVGFFLGLLNFFVKPILNAVAFPLRLLTIGLFGFLINMFLVWVVDVLFVEPVQIQGLTPLFLTTLIVWGLGIVFRLII